MDMSIQLMAAAAAEMYFLKKRDNFGCVNLSGCTQQTVAAAAEVYCLYCSLQPLETLRTQGNKEETTT